jgi:hypothetical protein
VLSCHLPGYHSVKITLVGQVVTIQSQTTNCVYWIDDGTGRVEARHWIDSTSEEDAGKWGGIEYIFSCSLSDSCLYSSLHQGIYVCPHYRGSQNIWKQAIHQCDPPQGGERPARTIFSYIGINCSHPHG